MSIVGEFIAMVWNTDQFCCIIDIFAFYGFFFINALWFLLIGPKGIDVTGIISHDGAGHHFSGYDFSETEAGEYTVFCVN